MFALIRYYSHFRLDPMHMSEDEVARAWCDLVYALKKTGQMEKE